MPKCLQKTKGNEHIMRQRRLGHTFRSGPPPRECPDACKTIGKARIIRQRRRGHTFPLGSAKMLAGVRVCVCCVVCAVCCALPVVLCVMSCCVLCLLCFLCCVLCVVVYMLCVLYGRGLRQGSVTRRRTLQSKQETYIHT